MAKKGNSLLAGFAEGLLDGLAEPPAASAPKASSIFTGTDGRTDRLAWARYQNMPGAGGGWGGANPFGVAPGGTLTRDRNQVAGVTMDLILSNPTLAALFENLTVQCCGAGLTLSSKLDADALGISREMTRDLSSKIERLWNRWATNKAHDFTGRNTFHELAAAGFRTWLVHGEVLGTIDYKRERGVRSGIRFALLDPRQLDVTISRTEQDGAHTWQGVTFSKDGRLLGYWLRRYPLGGMNQIAVPQYVSARTAWGRPKVVHILDLIDPRAVRGISPLAAALTPAHEKNMLSEFTTAAAALQTQFAISVESALPSRQALAGLNAAIDERIDDMPLADLIQMRADWYSKSRISATPGVVNYLPPGDQLHFHSSEHPTSTFDSFDKSLVRSAAKAAGSSFEETAGNFADTSFAASRLALGLPHRINLRRRKVVLEQLYRAACHAVVEEAFATGELTEPRGAPKFVDAPDLYLEAKWLGQGPISADPKKTTEAAVLAIENHLTTLADVLAEDGQDLEAVLEQRKAETEMLRAAGLETPGQLTTQRRITEDGDDGEQPHRKASR